MQKEDDIEEPAENNKPSEETLQNFSQATRRTTSSTNQTKKIDYPKSLELTKQEVEYMKDFSQLIGTNPRAIKRFVNVYQIIRAHDDLLGREESLSATDHLSIMFLLAVSIGPFRSMNQVFKDFITNDEKGSENLRYFLAQRYEKAVGAKLELEEQLRDKESYKLLLQISASEFKANHELVKRFTF
jgi:hypothetical protein